MARRILLTESDPATIGTPNAGSQNLIINQSGVMGTKNSSGVFNPVGGGGNGGGIDYEDIEYNDLYNKVINGQLIKDQWYRLTNYKSVNFLNGYNAAVSNIDPYNISVSFGDSNNFNARELHIGENEVLLIKAISPNEISPIGFSETYPNDIIYYNPVFNKIGVSVNYWSGGFNLQWDSDNEYVFFVLPSVLYGYSLNIYWNHNIDGDQWGGFSQLLFDPLLPSINGVISPTYYSESEVSFYSDIRIEEVIGGTRVILLNLTQQDFSKYTNNSLDVYTSEAIGDSYGWIVRRNDTKNIIDVPFDFRGIKYRRFETNINNNPNTAWPSFFSLGYYGFYNENLYDLSNSNGENYMDIPVFVLNFDQNNKYTSVNNSSYLEARNIIWGGIGSPDKFSKFCDFNDNNVFLSGMVGNSRILGHFNNNTFIEFDNNDIKGNFYNNITYGFNNNSVNGSVSNRAWIIEGNIINGSITTNSIYNFSGNRVNGAVVSSNIRNVIGNIFNTVVIQLETDNDPNLIFRNNTINSFGNNNYAFFASNTPVYQSVYCELTSIAGDNKLRLIYHNTSGIQYLAPDSQYIGDFL
jgi:hypothetical protein